MIDLIKLSNDIGNIENVDDSSMLKSLMMIKKYCEKRHKNIPKNVRPCEGCMLKLNIDKQITKKRMVVCWLGKKPLSWKIEEMINRNYFSYFCGEDKDETRTAIDKEGDIY